MLNVPFLGKQGHAVALVSVAEAAVGFASCFLLAKGKLRSPEITLLFFWGGLLQRAGFPLSITKNDLETMRDYFLLVTYRLHQPSLRAGHQSNICHLMGLEIQPQS